MKKVLFVDNFDSFSYILVDYLAQCGAQVDVITNLMPYNHYIQDPNLKGIVLSPGPSTPSESGNLLKIVNDFHNLFPILGVCLGHQALGLYWGLDLIHAKKPMHGKACSIQTKPHPLFNDVNNPLEVGRYHSLAISFPKNNHTRVESIAESEEGEIMAIKHQDYKHCGVQFHPESVLTPQGMKLISNWVNLILD